METYTQYIQREIDIMSSENEIEVPPTKKPKISNKKKKKRNKNKKKKENGGWKEGSSNLWVHARERTNALFEKYYDLQFEHTVPNWHEKERAEFLNALKTPLPQTFRISEAIDPDVHAQICSRIENEFVPEIAKIEIEDEVEDEEAPLTPETDGKRVMKKILRKVPPPRVIQWYPNNVGSPTADQFATKNSAWYFGVSKALFRKHPTLQKFRAYIMSQTERGNISRQEEVSMIPPMFFFSRMQPEDRILDMCAAPGSKTAQLLEMLYASSRKHNRPITGYVVGNDNDVKRAYLLVHQLQRLSHIFPNVIITNHDATQYPTLTVNGVKQLFTKVLCDVMCTGDGTLRKSPDLWKRWKPSLAWDLHDLQIRCVLRAFEICDVGGTIVYSTCSLNPIEDEAVVAEVIRRTNYNLELVDASKELPNLSYSPGMSSWVVTNIKSEPLTLEQYDQFFSKPTDEQQKIKEKLSAKITRDMFPPTPEEAKKMNLHYCMRLLPNLMDTGGFFVAVLRKVGDLKLHEGKGKAALQNNETTTTTTTETGKELIKVYKGKATQNEQFIPAREEILENIYQYYGIDKNIVPPEQLIIRLSDVAQERGADISNPDSITEAHIKKIYYVSKGIRDIVEANTQQQKWKLINLGVRMFERKKTVDFMPKECPFRFTQDFADQFAHALKKERIILMKKEDFVTFLKQLSTMVEDIRDEQVRQQIKRLSGGSVIVEYVPEKNQLNESTSNIYIAALKTHNNLMRHCSTELVKSILYRVESE